jgi:hypothetical protein
LCAGSAASFCQKPTGVAQTGPYHFEQPCVFDAEHPRPPAGCQARFVSGGDLRARVPVENAELRGVDRDMRAGGQPNQIYGIRHAADFVEVVDAPDQAAFDVAPCAEIFHVQIADGEQLRSFGALSADLGE